MRPMWITALGCVALAIVACGIDAVGTKPSDGLSDAGGSSSSGATSSSSGDPGDDDSGVVTPDAADDAASDAILDVAPDVPVGPVLELTHAAAPATVDLTTEGTLEWAYWGVLGSTTSVRKSGGATISGLDPSNQTDDGATATGFGTTFSWTNATSGSGASDGYVYVIGGVGANFDFTVPSSAAKRTLVVYVGGNQIRGKLTAELVDGTTTLTKTDTSYESQLATFGVRYAIDFRSLAAAVLTVRWEVDQAYGVNSARLAVVALR